MMLDYTGCKPKPRRDAPNVAQILVRTKRKEEIRLIAQVPHYALRKERNRPHIRLGR